jgi:hypothetical protein
MKQIDADKLIKWIEEEKRLTIKAMEDLGVNSAITLVLPQHYDKIKNKIESLVSESSERPFANWLKKNNYFKSRKGEKKTYESKFLEGQFTRKVLYGMFKKEMKNKQT